MIMIGELRAYGCMCGVRQRQINKNENNKRIRDHEPPATLTVITRSVSVSAILDPGGTWWELRNENQTDTDHARVSRTGTAARDTPDGDGDIRYTSSAISTYIRQPCRLHHENSPVPS